MIINTKPTYKCEYCLKVYQIKSACERHENHCSHNPDNWRACFGCVHCSKKTMTAYFDYYYGEHYEKVKILWCEKLSKGVVPPKAVAKGNWFDLGGDVANDPMPKHCEHRKEYQIPGLEHLEVK